MYKLLLVLAALVTIPLGQTVTAQAPQLFSSGNMLAEQLNNSAVDLSGQLARAVGRGYIAGVADALSIKGVICVSDQVTLGQLMVVTKRYLQDHPEGWHYSAASLAGAACRHHTH